MGGHDALFPWAFIHLPQEKDRIWMKGNQPGLDTHWRVIAKKEGNAFQVKAAKYFSKEIKLGIGFYKGELILTKAVQCAVENEQGYFHWIKTEGKQ